MTDPTPLEQVNKSVNDLEKTGVAVLLATWNKIKKYVYIGWALLTIVGVTGSVIEFIMLTDSGKEADKLKQEIKNLESTNRQLAIQIDSIEKGIGKITYIEKTNYVTLTNMGVQYANSVGAYAKFVSNNDWRSAIKHYNDHSN